MTQNVQPSSSSHHSEASPSSPKLGKYCSPTISGDIAKRSLTNYLNRRTWMPYKNCDVVQLARNHGPFLRRLNFMKKLPVHDGCVNTISWNKTGEYILSGSDDRYICVTKPTYLFDSSEDYAVLHKVQTLHLGNIFCARFMPNSGDTKIVSCSSGGPVMVHDLYATNPSESIFSFNCHSSTIYEVVPVPDDECVFLSCGEDKTIRLFDMRVHTSCARAGTCPHPALIRNTRPMTTLCLHPLNSNLMLIGRADGTGLVYDRRKLPDVSKFSREAAHAEQLAGSNSLSESFKKYRHPMVGAVAQFKVPGLEDGHRFTSLCYNKSGSQVLASYSGEYIYLFNHDKSSNFELKQTLAKKDEQESENQNLDTDIYPRIRSRNDWSDTGVHSRPRRSRATDEGPSSLTEFVLANTGRGPRAQDASSRQQALLFVEPINDSDRNQSRDYTLSARQLFDAMRANHDRDVDRESEQTDQIEDSASDISRDADTRGDDAELSNESDRKVSVGDRMSQSSKDKFKRVLDGLKDKYPGQIPTYKPRVKYQGHRNCRTSIKEAIFWGDDFVMSGSDCGRIIVWEKEAAKIVMAFQADERVVNCLEPNPTSYVLASSGIDYDIKLWSTQSLDDGPLIASGAELNAIVSTNEAMLKESKLVISVPQHLLLRVLASLAQRR